MAGNAEESVDFLIDALMALEHLADYQFRDDQREIIMNLMNYVEKFPGNASDSNYYQKLKQRLETGPTQAAETQESLELEATTPAMVAESDTVSMYSSMATNGLKRNAAPATVSMYGSMASRRRRKTSTPVDD